MPDLLNTAKGPRLRYDGNTAGLSAVGGTRAGDINSPFDWSVICGCNAFLGVLGSFMANTAGQRSLYCPKCCHLTVVSKEGQIQLHAPHDITKTRGTTP